MYEVIFYYDKDGNSEIVEWLDSLKRANETDKNSRINWEKTLAYIGALERYGTSIGMPYVKYLGNNLWELRPVRNRILFFCWTENRYILLHHFVKKTQKTPRREIEKALQNKKDYLEREEIE
ncbi:MAG: type II toxin-antitoxin system RelE/ParE family toxin [Firmicutes bacterium]|nr:type II toxin-antitoxin system RelE/ParE family toxin [Bacillota bacterium]